MRLPPAPVVDILVLWLVIAAAAAAVAWADRPIRADAVEAAVIERGVDYALVEWVGRPSGRTCSVRYDRIVVAADGTSMRLPSGGSLPPIERPDGRLAVRVHLSVPATLERPVEYRVTASVACNLVQRALGGYAVKYPPVVIEAASPPTQARFLR